jgi:hypothetical protein
LRIRFQADNDLNGLIGSATLRFERVIDFRTAHSAGLDGLSDDLVLERAAQDHRMLVTHDKRTMPGHFASLIRRGGRSPGVLVVIPQDVALARIVESLVLVWADDRPEDWINLITKVPF